MHADARPKIRSNSGTWQGIIRNIRGEVAVPWLKYWLVEAKDMLEIPFLDKPSPSLGENIVKNVCRITMTLINC
jgi:hypothetical protein